MVTTAKYVLGVWNGLDDFPSWASIGPGDDPPITDPGRAEQTALSLTAGVAVSVTSASAAPAPTKVTSTTSPLVINLDWDSSVSSAPAGFMTSVIAAAAWLESQFIDAVTLTFNVGYGEVSGNLLGSALGESIANMSTVSYGNLLSAVVANARTATDASVVASLPATSPIAGATYWVSTAQAQALGLAPASGDGVDGSVGFGVASLFTYGDTANSGTVVSGTYDFFGTAVHEFTELMGRTLQTGVAILGVLGSYTLMDLLHYSAPGIRDLSSLVPGYFSVDGGTTDLGDFNTVVGGDPGDWAASVPDDAFDAFADSGVIQAVSANDVTVLDAIGWEPAGASGAISPPDAVSTPTGVAETAATGFLASIQVNKGLAAGAALASITQTGGASADSYGFALGGAGAAGFALHPAGSGATLSVGAVAAAGAAGGALYALSLTATDVTSGASSPAMPVNVVVADNSNNVIALASLPGIVTAAPTFIYSGGGIDTIVGTGMTGTLYFDGGAGADTMTGGSGVNAYEYGGAADSTPSAMDIITNFNVAVDVIDLTGLGSAFTTVAALASDATTIATGSIGWQTIKTNTFVYANTNGRTEALSAANMKIELNGRLALAAANFSHD
jgi:hypothetical protein